MTAAALTSRHEISTNGMKMPFVSSIFFHVAIVIFAIVGLPFMTPEMPVIEDAISVEILEIDDKTQTDKPPEIKPVKKQPPQQTAEAPPKPVQPTVTAKTPPKPVAPAPPEKIEDVAPPAPEELAAPLKKPDPPKAKPKPPEKKPVVEKMAEPEEEQNEAFKSVLRNLMPTEAEQSQPKKEEKTGERAPLLTRLSAKMTTNELDSLKRQLIQCWSVQAGARFAEDLVVDLKLFVNPDRSVRDVQIQNRLRYNTDSFFRAAADSAVRAVYRCSPLDLPPEKHDLWDVITVRFDPREML